MTHTALTPRRELALLLTLAGVQFTHILDFMIMMPLGPQFRALFGISDAQFGLLVSAYTIAAGTSGLLASTYIDRYGRKRLLLTLYTLFGLATLACGLAPSYSLLMAARIAAGVFGGVLSAMSQTIVADVIPFERRGRAMGVVMTSFSVSTVAGVPLGLFLAATFSWHAPFFAIAGLCTVLIVLAMATLPPLDAHLQGARHSMLGSLAQVLADRNHRVALAFTALLMSSGFFTIPYITLYLQANAGFSERDIPYVYLCGGAVTLVSARLFGRMTDRLGKVPTFRRLALANLVPLVGVTLVGGAPAGVVLVATTLMFMFMSGRIIPGMAIITSAADPRLRGTFMTLSSSVQSASVGVASILGGLLIHRDAQGQVAGYWMAAVLGVLATLAAVWTAPRITLHGATAAPPPQAPASKG